MARRPEYPYIELLRFVLILVFILAVLFMVAPRDSAIRSVVSRVVPISRGFIPPPPPY
jgi:hypothetical protein